MTSFKLLAQPWWVNLLIIIPMIIFARWRTTGLQMSRRQLLGIAVFALAFGFVEAAVVVYLRAAVGLLPGVQGTLTDVQRSAHEFYEQAQSLQHFPQSLLTVEVIREAATLIMLVSLAWLSDTRARERWATFLWAFAVWDLAYYAGLWATVRWPSSFKDLDVLFLIPVPWLAQIWFPFVVSSLTLVAIALCTRKMPQNVGVTEYISSNPRPDY